MIFDMFPQQTINTENPQKKNPKIDIDLLCTIFLGSGAAASRAWAEEQQQHGQSSTGDARQSSTTGTGGRGEGRALLVKAI